VWQQPLSFAMSSDGHPPLFPLEGRDIVQVTRDEIVNAIDLAPQIHQFLGGPSIARISSSMVVKHGRHIQLCEARNMQYVSEHTDIRLPKVIDAWEVQDRRTDDDDEPNIGYIVMECVNGKQLSDIWPDLDPEGRLKVQSQLVEYIHQLRALKMDIPGPVGGGRSEGSFFTDYGAGTLIPKDRECRFNNHVVI
jgi:hypothetical protein